ncbi:MAG: hypothetical protein ACFCVH_13635 [Alphaproteobacteria bacterium]
MWAGIAAAAMLWIGQAAAADSIWDHNGSEMLWQAQGDSRIISYQVPRPGLPVAPGAVLFEGRRVGGTMEGIARTFRQGCPPAEYFVSGPILSETHVVLYGAAPVRAASGCGIAGYSDASSNAVLEFRYLRSGDVLAPGGNALVPGRDVTGGVVYTQPANEEYGQDAVGYQTFIIPLSSAAEITVHVDTGVASHVMPDMVDATLSCRTGESFALMPDGPLNVCGLDDVAANPRNGTLILDVTRYNHETVTCEPQRLEYSYAGLCN